MQPKDQIILLVTEYLSRRPEVLFAYLFWSVTESDAFRDVDLGVYVDETIADRFGYAFRMSGDLESLLGSRVDVICMNTAPDHMIHSISKGRVLINRDDDVRVDFITRSWSRYFDVQPRRLQAINDMLS